MADVSVGQVIRATRCPPPAVERHWPLVLDALRTHGVGVASWASQVALAATIAIETRQEFRPVEERLYYTTAERLCEVWPSRFPDLTSAGPYLRSPERLANYVYAGRNGNGGPESGDGWRYRGRGLMQLTGRDTYARCGVALGEDLAEQPDRVMEPGISAQAAAWFWVQKGIPAAADAGDWKQVRRLVNGGLMAFTEFMHLVRAFGLAP